MKEHSDILLSDDFRRLVKANLDRDPVRIALDRRTPHAAMVASQVKYLKRAERKLPSFYAACCILPPLAFEQSSSEAAAARKEHSGALAIDLTCGLGVDSLYLARRFDRVIALERDPELAAIARENFRRLGADNIQVIDIPAEEFLSHTATRADLVYADPDRRDAEGKKMVRIEDCSPDITALLPRIEKIAPRLVVKLSPLFDVDEVFRIFSGSHTLVEVVSLDGECKEIVADLSFGPHSAEPAVPAIRAVAIGLGEVEYNSPPSLCEGKPVVFKPGQYRHLVIPDVALQKARLARRYLTEHGVWIESDNGYGFTAEPPVRTHSIMAKIVDIETIEPFDPKALKRRLRDLNIKSIDIMKREFPLSATDIARQLGVREGGSQKIAFTRAAGKLWQIKLIT